MSRTYSRFNWRDMRYDYFAGAEDVPFGGVPPRQPRGDATHPLGVDIEDALRDLPRGARPTGHGDRARGEVVRPEERPVPLYIRGLSGDVQPAVNWTRLAWAGGALALAAAAVWFVFRDGRERA